MQALSAMASDDRIQLEQSQMEQNEFVWALIKYGPRWRKKKPAREEKKKAERDEKKKTTDAKSEEATSKEMMTENEEATSR